MQRLPHFEHGQNGSSPFLTGWKHPLVAEKRVAALVEAGSKHTLAPIPTDFGIHLQTPALQRDEALQG